MTRIAWATDIHLNCLPDEKDIVSFCEKLTAPAPDFIVITGDISTAKDVVHHLSVIERIVQRPVYFVLGNHDYYGSSVLDVRKKMNELMGLSEFLKYLPSTPYVKLSDKTALIGHDGWYDGLNGDAMGSRYLLADWYRIADFVKHSGGQQYMHMMGCVKDKTGLLTCTQALAKDAIDHVAAGIKQAAKDHKNIIVATHVPPFEESHMYNGKIGGPGAQPWFTSKLMGDTLRLAALAYKDVQFTVLAGHTHGDFEGNIMPNLKVLVGGALYHQPMLQRIITVD